MIATNLNRLGRCKGISPNLDKAVDWLLSGAWKTLPIGRAEIEGDRVYAMVQAYESKAPETVRYEAHRAYLDIQVLVSGEEVIEVADTARLQVAVPYAPDAELFAVPMPNLCYSMLMRPGDALVLYPEDAHRPGLAVGGKSGTVAKIVVKVAL